MAGIYSELPDHLNKDIFELGIKNEKLELTDFLATRLPPKEVAQIKTIYQMRLPLDKALKTTQERVEKKKNQRVTSKQRQKMKVFKVEIKPEKYASFMPLHQLWLEYFRKVMVLDKLDCSPGQDLSNFYARLTKADFHGCIMTVTRSRCPSMVGLTGILLQEGRNSMKLLTKEDKIKIIPKSHNVFTFEVDGFMFVINGDHFCVKTAERAVKKFKDRPTIDL